MAFTINHIVLVGGNLTRDAELRYASNGNARVSFSVAMNRSYKDQSGQTKDAVEFFNIVYWGKLAEAVAPHLKKGKKVAIEGRLSQRRYSPPDGQARDYVEVVAASVILIGGKPDGGGGYEAPRSTAAAAPQTWQNDHNVSDHNAYSMDGESSQFFDESPMDENDVPF